MRQVASKGSDMVFCKDCKHYKELGMFVGTGQYSHYYRCARDAKKKYVYTTGEYHLVNLKYCRANKRGKCKYFEPKHKPETDNLSHGILGLDYE